MRVALLCTIDPAQLPLLASLREEHYQFLAQERSKIIFGGPLRSEVGGAPETMLIVLEVPTLEDAQTFIDGEPYNQHGAFSEVRIRPWSQVFPELDEEKSVPPAPAERDLVAFPLPDEDEEVKEEMHVALHAAGVEP